MNKKTVKSTVSLGEAQTELELATREYNAAHAALLKAEERANAAENRHQAAVAGLNAAVTTLKSLTKVAVR